MARPFDVGGCAQGMAQRQPVNYGDDTDWLESINEIGRLIDPAATSIQISIGAWDMCGVCCGTVGSRLVPQPLAADRQLRRQARRDQRSAVDPEQLGRLFQDNFATTEPSPVRSATTGANDILPVANSDILPGDSATATVVDPVVGIATDPVTGVGLRSTPTWPCRPQGQAGQVGRGAHGQRDALAGGGLGRGRTANTWYKVRFDNARTQNNTTIVPDVYCVDLNDNLFTPGDTIEYFYDGMSVGGAKSYFFGGYHAFDNFDASGAIVTTTTSTSRTRIRWR